MSDDAVTLTATTQPAPKSETPPDVAPAPAASAEEGEHQDLSTQPEAVVAPVDQSAELPTPERIPPTVEQAPEVELSVEELEAAYYHAVLEAQADPLGPWIEASSDYLAEKAAQAGLAVDRAATWVTTHATGESACELMSGLGELAEGLVNRDPRTIATGAIETVSAVLEMVSEGKTTPDPSQQAREDQRAIETYTETVDHLDQQAESAAAHYGDWMHPQVQDLVTKLNSTGEQLADMRATYAAHCIDTPDHYSPIDDAMAAAVEQRQAYEADIRLNYGKDQSDANPQLEAQLAENRQAALAQAMTPGASEHCSLGM